MKQHFKNAIPLLFLSLGLWGCVNVFPEPAPPPTRVVLRPALKVDKSLPSVSWNLKVDRPHASESLDTARIMVVHVSQNLLTMEYIAATEWEDPLPWMIQKQVLEAFTKTGKVPKAWGTQDHFDATYILELDIRHFEVDLKEGALPKATLEIVAHMVRLADRAIIGQKVFSVQKDAKGKSLAAITQAFEGGLAAILASLVQWMVSLKG